MENNHNELSVSRVMKDLMRINIHDSLYSLVKHTNWNENTCLVVLDDDNNVFGLITERSINYAKRKQLNFNVTMAWEISSNTFTTIPLDTTLKDAIDTMIRNKVRHLIVVDIGTPVGIITPLDILSLIDWESSRGIAIPKFHPD